MLSIQIVPAEGGWVVQAPDLAENGMVFRSGRKAEKAGLKLAESLAEQGMVVTLEIYLRDGRLAARSVTAPAVGTTQVIVPPRT